MRICSVRAGHIDFFRDELRLVSDGRRVIPVKGLEYNIAIKEAEGSTRQQ